MCNSSVTTFHSLINNFKLLTQNENNDFMYQKRYILKTLNIDKSVCNSVYSHIVKMRCQ